jgi:hypothetical protein
VYPTDTETRRQLALERTETLARSAQGPATRSRARRERLGFWLVEIGLRIACDRPVPTQA